MLQQPSPARLLLGGAGLLLTFFGYTTFRFGLVLSAFLGGATAVLPFVERVPADPAWLRPVVLGGAGLLAALLVLAAWRVGVAILAMVLLVSLALRLPALLPADPGTRLLVLAAVAAAGALLSRALERLALTAATASYGALLLSTALLDAATRVTPRLAVRSIEPGTTAFWVWSGLALAGFLVQNARLSRGRRPSGHDE